MTTEEFFDRLDDLVNAFERIAAAVERMSIAFERVAVAAEARVFKDPDLRRRPV